MAAITLLIKPASSLCDLACSYCFYRDEAANRESASRGIMSAQIAETVILRALEAAGAHGCVHFAFQGGEPLLAGIDFFETFIELTQTHNRNYCKISWSIQTNGMKLDDGFAMLFAKHRFLVGLSLDGAAGVHDACRKAPDGKGSHSRVMRAAAILSRHGADFNILAVLTEQNAKKVGATYNFMKKNGFSWVQYIPCMPPLDGTSGEALTADGWQRAHCLLFDLWYADFEAYTRGGPVPPSIRYFDNLLCAMLGKRPEQCGMNGCCTLQHVVEADGSVYPCDFYALDEYRLGSIADFSLSALETCDIAAGFLTRRAIGSAQREKCSACRYRVLCGSGCVRYFRNGEYQYCDAVRAFFAYAGARLACAAAYLRSQ